jgi:hypothetical protein
LFAYIREIPLVFYCGLRWKWGKEEYIVCYISKDRIGTAWLKVGVQKLRAIARGIYVSKMSLMTEGGRCIHY